MMNVINLLNAQHGKVQQPSNILTIK